MGTRQAKFQERTLREFEETTPFNRAEIVHAFSIFSELYTQQLQTTNLDRSPHHIRTGDGFANPDCEIPIEFITENFTKLQNNPFKEQICKAFCTSDSGLMSFTEFLDMVSSFSPKADIEKKIFHAFQIFDVDGDGLINRDDLYKVIDMMTGEDSRDDDDETLDDDQKDWLLVKKWLVNGVFGECHKSCAETQANPNVEESVDHTDNSDPQEGSHKKIAEQVEGDVVFKSKEALTIEDFRYCIYKSPDFRNTFSFNI